MQDRVSQDFKKISCASLCNLGVFLKKMSLCVTLCNVLATYHF